MEWSSQIFEEDQVNERGVTLVELLVLIGILALAAALAGQGFVEAATKQKGKVMRAELAAELRAARHLAMTRRERIQVVFDQQVMQIRTEPVDHPGIVLRRYDYHGKGMIVEELSNGTSVIFYPSGRTATPTTITLTNAAQERWKVTVSITGRISIL